MKYLSYASSAAHARLLCMALVLAGVIFAGNARAQLPAAPGDGWHTWRVKAAEEAPPWCCFDWEGRDPTATRCNLDSGAQHYMSRRDGAHSAAQMQIYVRISDGKPAAIHAFGPGCTATADTDIARHGVMEADDSAAWLAGFVSPRNRVSTQALAAIAVHAGRIARDTLIETASDGPDLDNRKDAVFWMGQVRGRELFAQIRKLMFTDADPEIREHAAFSLSQSRAEQRTDALRELGAQDPSAKVRGQTWFWLAQTGDPETEEAILHALTIERVRSVRDQAIFALAQLPEQRAVPALIGIVEHPDSSSRDRERAIFWMAQSDSALAMDYLAGIFDS